MAAGGKDDLALAAIDGLFTRRKQLQISDFRLQIENPRPRTIFNLKSAIYNLCNSSSLIRNHPQNFAEISITHQAGFAHLAFGFCFLGRQDVTQVRVSPLHLSRPGLILKRLAAPLCVFNFGIETLSF